MQHLMPFDGPIWRILPESLADRPSSPARAPEGRFHYSGQTAAYASLSAEGASVAMKRYLADGMSRMLVQMWLKADHVCDVRGHAAASVVWQDIRASGEVSPTWAISDTARKAGAQAMLYSSRSRPELSHIVVFEPKNLKNTGPAIPFKVHE